MIRLEKTGKTCKTAHGLPRALNSMNYPVLKLPREPVSGFLGITFAPSNKQRTWYYLTIVLVTHEMDVIREICDHVGY
jgi:ABC-type transporter Mla maintaining outer membrane lipid asymmetry ATPase subunit MlaF